MNDRDFRIPGDCDQANDAKQIRELLDLRIVYGDSIFLEKEISRWLLGSCAKILNWE